MKFNILFMYILLLGFLFVSCNKAILSEDQLKKLSIQKVMDLAAEKYGDYEYEGALYYYKMIDKLYPEDTDEYNEARAWAKYEIGYIYYQQNNYEAAISNFNEVIKVKTKSTAPLLLANKMRGKLMAAQKK